MKLPVSIQRGRRALAGLLAAAALGASAQAGGIFYRVALLTPSQEPGNVVSEAIGAGTFLIDTCNNTVSFYISFSCLSSPETAAHFHGFAPPGMNAGVIQPLPPGNPKIGVWTYPEASENALLDGRVYVNIHTVNNPGGEIRGQVVSHVAQLDPMQETPPIAGLAGRGFGLFNINPVSDTLSFYVSYGGLSSAETAAHIHGIAEHGTPAGVVFPLPAANPKVGVWNYPAAMEDAIMDGLTYVNIHTVNNGGGEIRGQICPIVAPIDGLQEVPPTPSQASAYGLFSIDRTGDMLGFDIVQCRLANETAAHIHGFAPRGVPAGVIFPLPAPAIRKLGVWNYPAANEDMILDGQTYVNLHTVAFGGGEIRGQIEFPVLQCIGDLDCDRDVDLADLATLLANFGAGGATRSQGDIDGDGDVDLSDLATLLARFGATC